MVELARQRQTQPCIAQGTKVGKKSIIRSASVKFLHIKGHMPLACPTNHVLLNPSPYFLRAKACSRRKGYRESIARCFRVHGWLCYPRSLQRTMNGNSSLFFKLSTFIIKFTPLSWQRVVSFGTLEALAIPKKPNHLLSLIEVRWPGSYMYKYLKC